MRKIRLDFSCLKGLRQLSFNEVLWKRHGGLKVSYSNLYTKMMK
nr:MAG TPA: hypothetical protein [Caudoviricetes sp.]